jgi:ATP-grasp domain
MLRSLRSCRLLTGYRQCPSLDVVAFAELLHRVSAMVEDIPEITELDLNRSSSGSTAPLSPTSASASPDKPAGDVGLGRTGRRTLASRCARRRDEQ